VASKSGKNVHLTHIEDATLYGGIDATKAAIEALRGIRDMLAGNSPSHLDLTVKVDGSPAVFFGTDPQDGKFFVAKKSIFNKTPKVYKSVADVKEDTSGDLQSKMVTAFNELSSVIKGAGVYQGDLMFTSEDLQSKTIDGEKYITFQANTIVYAIPARSDLAKEVLKARIGVVVHTRYSGKDFLSMTSSAGVKSSEFKDSPRVWLQDASVKDLSGTVTLTQSEMDSITVLIQKAETLLSKIGRSTIDAISGNPTFATQIETFNNTFVRAGQSIGDSSKHADALIKWFNDRFDKESSEKKSDKGKKSVEARRVELMRFFSKSNVKSLTMLFELQKVMVLAKEKLINKLSSISALKTFLRTHDGYRVTGQEGFVVSDRLTNNTLKLVDRLEFSFANFSPDIKKSWQV
jgi:hypothetical protein